MSYLPTKKVNGVEHFELYNPALVIRTVRKDMTSRSNGMYGTRFKYPEQGKVQCPDWNSIPSCGNGLHGCTPETGLGQLMSYGGFRGCKLLLIEAHRPEVVYLGGNKIKFNRGNVIGVYNSRTKVVEAALEYLRKHMTRSMRR